MEVLPNSIKSTTAKFQNRNMLLQHLDRNQKDIAQYYTKLCSYISEPRTYEQHKILNMLKERARYLRDANKKICSLLKSESDSPECSTKAVNVYFQNFKAFSKAVLDYRDEVSTHQTAAIA